MNKKYLVTCILLMAVFLTANHFRKGSNDAKVVEVTLDSTAPKSESKLFDHSKFGTSKINISLQKEGRKSPVIQQSENSSKSDYIDVQTAPQISRNELRENSSNIRVPEQNITTINYPRNIADKSSLESSFNTALSKNGLNNSKSTPKNTLSPSENPNQINAEDKMDITFQEVSHTPSTEALNQQAEYSADLDNILLKKAQAIAINHADRTGELEEISYSEEAISEDEIAFSEDDIDDTTDVLTLVEMLQLENTTDIRLQALYILADTAPELIANYLDDPDELIRYESEWIMQSENL